MAQLPFQERNGLYRYSKCSRVGCDNAVGGAVQIDVSDRSNIWPASKTGVWGTVLLTYCPAHEIELDMILNERRFNAETSRRIPLDDLVKWESNLLDNMYELALRARRSDNGA